MAFSKAQNIYTSSVSERDRDREREKKGPGKTETRDKNTLDTYAVWDSIIKWLWIILCMLAWIFHKRCIWKVHQNKLFDFDNYYNNHTLLLPHLFENE